jgi:hypothetical protein
VTLKKFISLTLLIVICEAIALYSINGTTGGQSENNFGNDTFTISLAGVSIVISLTLLVLSAKAKILKYVLGSVIIIIASCVTAFYAYFIAGWS